MFSSAASYAAGNAVNYQGILYIANTAVPAGVWNPAAWTPITNSVVSPQLNLMNGKLVESHASNAATFSIQTSSGATPSAANPVGVIFSDGSVLWITAALSITIPAGSTLSTGSAWPFRLWFAIINSSGTPVLCVRFCYGVGGAISGFGGHPIITCTAIGATTVSATNYGNIAGSGRYRIIGYANYNSGLATAGNWAVSPDLIFLQSAGDPVPGDVVNELCLTSGQQSTTSSSYINITALIANFTISSVINPVRVQFACDIYFINSTISSSAYGNFTMVRNPGGVVMWPQTVKGSCTYQSQVVSDQMACDVLDYPHNGAPQYIPQIYSYGSYGTFYLPYQKGIIHCSEIMG
jgi:hypothetical protein